MPTPICRIIDRRGPGCPELRSLDGYGRRAVGATIPPLLVPVLAQSSRYHDLGYRFQQGGSEISIGHLIAIGALVLTVIGLLAWIARRIAIRDGHGYRSPRRLFRELCRLHELDWPARRLLGRLAREQGLPHRAYVFVQPECFQGDQLPPALQPMRGQIEAIGTKLFGNANREPAEDNDRTPDHEARSR